ncbi:ribosomal protein L4 domain-containing protein [Ganoderma leucocontextum]|nr:ribosomal protein L4 domain-containing protein [Ganoderma leucocontextum]
MLAVVRRALGQTPHLTRRHLSAIVSSAAESPSVESPASHLRQTTEAASSLVGQNASGILPVSFAGVRPVYLQLSSLIRPEENVDPPDGLVELDPAVFDHPIRRDILHLCVVHYLDCQRQGSASTKTRGEVRGSGRKIRPQKGSGRARLGDGQSPMLRGGGVAFGPRPRDFATKLNRKVIEMGMRVALSARIKEHSLGVVQSLDWQGFKTKDLETRIEELGWRRTLFVTGQEKIPEGLRRAGGNLSGMDIVTAGDLNVYHALKWPRLVLDLQAVEWFERALGRSSGVSPRDYSL